MLPPSIKWVRGWVAELGLVVKAWLLERLKQEKRKADYSVRPCFKMKSFENFKNTA